ncbi:hypothetical protein DPMN_059021 [Dreissena polymorpha]|uniref:Uncharacterized protein n=1 Tax=Dreissena polymorpha TaxID=45954 RepID=A0A9D4C369_DREPO|nr:hypothetical protein DPMN_059021 [Dreissena polymorpha]
MLSRFLLYSSVVENYELRQKPTSSWLGLITADGTPSVCPMIYLVWPPTTGACVIDCTSVRDFARL